MATPSASSAIELLRSHSLTSVVHRELERRILAGELAPGDKLNEADIAGELSVSRGPVREAFRALEQAGLVRTEKNRGVFVRQVSVEEADEIYEVRAGLDEMIGRLAAERATAEEVDELKDMVKRMQQVARNKDVAAYYPMNVRFHDRLAEVSGNKTLAATYRRLVNELHLYRRETLARGANSFPISTREHAQIIDAIARGDAEEAGVLLREHAMQSRDRLHATIVKKGKVTK
jgi:phosphonate utilization transcriptional regulator